jgi:hypothetical protein
MANMTDGPGIAIITSENAMNVRMFSSGITPAV